MNLTDTYFQIYFSVYGVSEEIYYWTIINIF